MKNWILPLLSFFALLSPLEGAYVVSKGTLVNEDNCPKYFPEKHYELGAELLNAGNYSDAWVHFNIITKNFPNAPCYNDSFYFLGVCYFYQDEYEFANQAFSSYIQCQKNPCYFEEAVNYKLQIANCFREGARRRIMGYSSLPKWLPARVLALEIYNEVITAVPCHELATFALYGRALLYWEDQDYRESVDSFQILIRRFPHHELTPVAFLNINRVYLEQVQNEFQNPDLLVLSEINLKKFSLAFPKDERVTEAQEDVQMIRELYAKGLFETGQFYERKEYPLAAEIYYKSAIQQFPDTSYARCCSNRLSIISPESKLDACDCTP